MAKRIHFTDSTLPACGGPAVLTDAVVTKFETAVTCKRCQAELLHRAQEAK